MITNNPRFAALATFQAGQLLGFTMKKMEEKMLVVMFFLNVALGVCFAFFLIFSAIFYPEHLLEPLEPIEKKRLMALLGLEVLIFIISGLLTLGG